MVEKAEKKQMI